MSNLSHKLEGYVVPTVLYTAHSPDCYQYIVPKGTLVFFINELTTNISYLKVLVCTILNP